MKRLKEIDAVKLMNLVDRSITVTQEQLNQIEDMNEWMIEGTDFNNGRFMISMENLAHILNVDIMTATVNNDPYGLIIPK